MTLRCTQPTKKMIFIPSAITLALFSGSALAGSWTCEQLDKLNTRSQQVVTPSSICESLVGDAGAFAARSRTTAGAFS
ncbi:hypothetical protein OCJ35_21135 [Pluralibacter gergoviae]|uniref:hypothetical protein n=1 Tax=Pluralibacter gergoviae TaxID=61647 RepID=UPI001FF29CDC|nr:hypothetical protein [Pluralibacter gergoviae]MCK1067031.1 hypothetical protein [Pluralibacter gergoviae]MCV7760595.1 hypothetical protein [Pluralibacter gergoviae]